MVEGTPAHESNTNNTWEDRLPQDLIDKIKSGNCIAFVGAGFSFPANVCIITSTILLSSQSLYNHPNNYHKDSCLENINTPDFVF